MIIPTAPRARSAKFGQPIGVAGTVFQPDVHRIQHRVEKRHAGSLGHAAQAAVRTGWQWLGCICNV